MYSDVLRCSDDEEERLQVPDRDR
ncbi:uncharacterized protein METZ01_LOCUS426798 [marine metagenome]|uniref:Uncharacterized protein n=1 Tax=marine metagenome TaxID=408172 RepID=A0A382XSU2_9ZZZZ